MINYVNLNPSPTSHLKYAKKIFSYIKKKIIQNLGGERERRVGKNYDF
jgi:hypothetical protein